MNQGCRNHSIGQLHPLACTISPAPAQTGIFQVEVLCVTADLWTVSNPDWRSVHPTKLSLSS